MRPVVMAAALLLPAPALSAAAPKGPAGGDERAGKARALLVAKDCDQLLLSYESTRPTAGKEKEDAELARVLAEAGGTVCSSDKVVGYALCETAARLAPGDVEVQLALARQARAASQLGDAVAALDRAMAAAPRDARPRLLRAEIALAEREPAAALAALEPIRQDDPRARELYAQAEKQKAEAPPPPKSTASEKALRDTLALNRAASEKARPAPGPGVPGRPPSTGVTTGVPGEEGMPPEDDGQGGDMEGQPGKEALEAEPVLSVRDHLLKGKYSGKIPAQAGKQYQLALTAMCFRNPDPKNPAAPFMDLRVKVNGAEQKLVPNPVLPMAVTLQTSFTATGKDLVEVWDASARSKEPGCSISELVVQ